MNETQSKIIFQTSNRAVLFWISLALFLIYNTYYGWNAKPMSDMEQWWDNFTIILLAFSLFVKKLHFVIIDKRSQS